MLFEYQLKIADLYNIPTGNVETLVAIFYDKEQHMIDYENLQLYLRLGSKPKKIHCILELNQSRRLKQHVELNTQKRIEAEKNGYQDGKALNKLMNNAVYGKAKENLRKKIDVKLVSNKKDQDGKALNRLMNNAVYRKTMEN